MAAAGVTALLWMDVRAGRDVQVDSGYRVVMGTFSRIVVIAPNRPIAAQCIDAAFKDQDEIERLMSYHRPDSELAEVNSEAYDHPVRLSEPMLEVLRKALETSRLSEGAFDVTVGPLMDMWKYAGQVGIMPTDAQMEHVRAKVGWDKVVLDPNQRTIRFAVEGMKIDLGGIAKGYAVDRSVQVLRDQGALSGMVDIGGNIRCFGRPPRGKEYWRIGIQDPCRVDGPGPSSDCVLLVLKLTNQAVATSGHYRRFTMVGDREVSHILDPRTGASNEQLASVTIIAPDAMTADALSTAVSILGKEKGFSLAESLPQIEAIGVVAESRAGPRSDQTSPGIAVVKTRGADRFIAGSVADPVPARWR